jgi:hypothetical protein
MKTGDLLLVHRIFKWHKPKSYLSAAIRWFTNFYWNHTAIIVMIDNVAYVLEAVGNGVILKPYETWKLDTSIISEYVSIGEDIPTYEALYYLGHKYDFISLTFYQVIYQITRKLFKKGLWIGRKGNKAKGKLYCSELFATIHDLKDAERLTTADIYKLYL